MRTRQQQLQEWTRLREKTITVNCYGEDVTYLCLPSEGALDQEIASVKELVECQDEDIVGDDKALVQNYLQRLNNRKKQITAKERLVTEIYRMNEMTLPFALSPLLRKVSKPIPKSKISEFEDKLRQWHNDVGNSLQSCRDAKETLSKLADDQDWPTEATLAEEVSSQSTSFSEVLFTWAVCGFNVLDESILTTIQENAVTTEMPMVSSALSHGEELLEQASKGFAVIEYSKKSYNEPLNAGTTVQLHKSAQAHSSHAPVKSEHLGEGSNSERNDEDSLHSSSIDHIEMEDILDKDVLKAAKKIRLIIKQLRKMKVQLETNQDVVSSKLFKNKLDLFGKQLTEAELFLEESEMPLEVEKWISECTDLLGTFEKQARVLELNLKREEFNCKAMELNSKNLPEFNGLYSSYTTWKRQLLQSLEDSKQPEAKWKLIVSTSCFRKCTGKARRMIDRAINENSSWESFIVDLDCEFGEPTVLANIILNRIKDLKKPTDDDDPLSVEMGKTIAATDAELIACNVKEMVCQSLMVEEVFAKLPPKVKDYVAERRHLKRPLEVWDLVVEGFREKRGYLMSCRQNYYALHQVQSADKDRTEKKYPTNNTKVKKSTTSSSSDEKTKSYEPCPLCDGKHAVWSRLCEMTGSDLTAEVVNKLNSLDICLRCGRKRGDCQGKCNGKYKTRDGKLKSSDCVKCKSETHFRLCKCNYEETAGSSTKTGNVSVAEKTASHTVPLAEYVQVMDPNTKQRKTVLMQYDSGSQRSWTPVDFELVGEYEKTEFLKIEGFAGSGTNGQDVDTFSYVINVEGKAEVIELSKFGNLTGVPKSSTPIPTEWKDKFFTAKYNTGSKKTDILLGLDYNGFFPEIVDRKGHLALYKSKITGKFIVGGSTKTHKPATVQCKPVKAMSCTERHKQFMEILTCENIDLSDKKHQKQLEKEDEDLYASLEHRDGRWCASYNYYGKLKGLRENKQSVEKMMKSISAKLEKRPHLKPVVVQQISSNLERHHWVPVSMLSLDKSLQRHYLPWNFVINENSSSTPVRLVTNSSNKDPNGLSLNECQVQGSSNVGDLRKVLVILRASQQIAIGDLSKYFNSFQLPDEDVSLRRLLIPNDLVPESHKHLITPESLYLEVAEASMPFGDSAAAWLAVLGRVKNAKKFSELVPQFQDRLLNIYINQSYVDDCVVTGKWEEDLRPLMDAMKRVAGAGGFTFKEFIILGDDKCEKTLGYMWNAKSDTLGLKNWLNLGGNERGLKLEGDLTPDNVEQRVMKSFTKRDALSCQGQVFDPLGLYLPMTIKLRLLYGDVSIRHPGQGKDDWKKEIDDDLKQRFVKIFNEFWKAKKVVFPRSVIPQNVKQGERLPATLATFCDGGDKAYSAACYLVTQTDKGAEARLLNAMAKTSGTKRLSIPRIELLGAELAVKLWHATKKNLPEEIDLVKSLFFSDSTTVLRQLQSHSGSFNVFVGTRVQTIQTETNIDDWRYVPTEKNPADLATKDKATVDDLLSKKWKHGEFLCEAESDWPVRLLGDLPGKTEPIPDLAKGYSIAAEVTAAKLSASKVINYPTSPSTSLPIKMIREITTRAKNWETAKNTISFVLKAVEIWRSCLNNPAPKTSAPARQHCAQRLLLQSTMEETRELLKKSKVSQYKLVESDEGIVYAIGRTLESVGEKRVPVVNGASQIGLLILQHWHNLWGHGQSVKRVEAKLRERFYIPYCQKRLEKIRKECPTCRKLDAEAMQQKMGPLPTNRFQFTKPFFSVQIDIAGPFSVRDGVKKRTSMKHWVLACTCEATRGTFACAMDGYDADAVLRALEMVKCQHGQFSFCHSDLGSNLVKAGKVLEEQYQLVKTAVMSKYPDAEFSFGPAKAPWVQGTVESIIKLLKVERRRRLLLNGDRLLTSLEFDQAVRSWANMVNNRPLVYNPEIGAALTPNDLLHGRSHNNPSQALQVSGQQLKRQRDVAEHAKKWWEAFNESVRRDKLQKWKDENRNVKEGDIVWLLDCPSRTGFYKLGRIVNTKQGSDGLVRSCAVKYFNSSASGCKEQVVQRHVRSLALVNSEE